MLLFFVILTIFLFFCILFYIIKHAAVQKVRSICPYKKYCLLNELARPSGFLYVPSENIFTSDIHAWQRNFGYHASFDKTAWMFQIVFDFLPVYFDDQGQTWLIEFWKGQYGINTGCEIGIYHSGTLLSPDQYSDALFQSASNEEMLLCSMELYHKNTLLFSIQKLHWWLTGFVMGHFCEPDELSMKISVTFPDADMMDSFLCALCEKPHRDLSVDPCSQTVFFTFGSDASPEKSTHPFTQWKNRIFCRLFVWITRPFENTADRLLLLYYLLPPIFKHTIKIRKCP